MTEIYGLYGPYLWLGLAGLVLLSFIWLLVLQVRLNKAVRHYTRITRGVDGGDLKWILERELWRIQEAAEKADSLDTRYQQLAADLQRCVQRVGVVRFNPFQDVGGDQSFTIALLDARGDGVVLTGIYSRKDTRFYAKPIQGGASGHALSPEEQQALLVAGAPGAAAQEKQE